MATNARSTRRRFMVTAGTALSAPLAAAAATAPTSAPVPVVPDDPAQRLARLEAIEAIRGLNQSYGRHVNDGAHNALASLFVDPAAASLDPSIRGLAADPLGEDDAIEVASDGQTATARLNRVAHAEDAIGPSCPLVEMAREQGGGVVRSSARVVFENAYVKHDGTWKYVASSLSRAE